MLNPSKRRLYTLISIGAVFTLFGIVMIVNGRKGGWPATAVFGLFTTIFAVELYSNWVRSRNTTPTQVLDTGSGALKLYSSRWKSSLIAIACAGLAALSASAVIAGPTSTIPLMVYATVSFAFVVFALIIGAAARWPNRLILSRDNFAFSALAQKEEWHWRDVSRFEVGRIRPLRAGLLFGSGARVVSFDVANVPDTKARRRMLRSTGKNAGFINTFCLEDEELVKLLNAWRDRALNSK